MRYAVANTRGFFYFSDGHWAYADNMFDAIRYGGTTEVLAEAERMAVYASSDDPVVWIHEVRIVKNSPCWKFDLVGHERETAMAKLTDHEKEILGL